MRRWTNDTESERVAVNIRTGKNDSGCATHRNILRISRRRVVYRIDVDGDNGFSGVSLTIIGFEGECICTEEIGRGQIRLVSPNAGECSMGRRRNNSESECVALDVRTG